VRATLVAALISCAEEPLQCKARRFLLGLSCDELQFLAEFLGSSILECSAKRPCSRAQLAARIAEFQRERACFAAEQSADRDHKMILLLEFLCRSGLQQVPVAVRAHSA
jgi:hypothetical protein